jgi:hypothetical protein
MPFEQQISTWMQVLSKDRIQEQLVRNRIDMDNLIETYNTTLCDTLDHIKCLLENPDSPILDGYFVCQHQPICSQKDRRICFSLLDKNDRFVQSSVLSLLAARVDHFQGLLAQCRKYQLPPMPPHIPLRIYQIMDYSPPAAGSHRELECKAVSDAIESLKALAPRDIDSSDCGFQTIAFQS